MKRSSDRELDLLFPSIKGGFRAQKVLKVPIVEVGTTKHLTQRAHRRTFARSATSCGPRK